jgi:hypothetical protein
LRKTNAGYYGDTTPPSLDAAATVLIGALRSYVNTAGVGSGESTDGKDEAVIALFQRILRELSATGDLPGSGSPARGMTKSQLPLGVVAKDDDHRAALLASIDMTRMLVKQAAKNLNQQARFERDVEQDLGDLEHQRGAELRKAADAPRKATSLSDITGD